MEGGPGTTAALRGLPASQPLTWGAGGGHFLREAPDSVPFEFLKFPERDPGLQEPALDCRGGGAGGGSRPARGWGAVRRWLCAQMLCTGTQEN